MMTFDEAFQKLNPQLTEEEIKKVSVALAKFATAKLKPHIGKTMNTNTMTQITKSVASITREAESLQGIKYPKATAKMRHGKEHGKVFLSWSWK